jgi:hypothetical protein
MPGKALTVELTSPVMQLHRQGDRKVATSHNEPADSG